VVGAVAAVGALFVGVAERPRSTWREMCGVAGSWLTKAGRRRRRGAP